MDLSRICSLSQCRQGWVAVPGIKRPNRVRHERKQGKTEADGCAGAGGQFKFKPATNDALPKKETGSYEE